MNCPENYDKCDNLCYLNYDNKCHSVMWSKPVSLYDLMTHEELMAEIQKMIKPQPEWNGKQWDTIQQLRAAFLHYQNKVDKLLESRKPKKQSKYG